MKTVGEKTNNADRESNSTASQKHHPHINDREACRRFQLTISHQELVAFRYMNQFFPFLRHEEERFSTLSLPNPVPLKSIRVVLNERTGRNYYRRGIWGAWGFCKSRPVF